MERVSSERAKEAIRYDFNSRTCNPSTFPRHSNKHKHRLDMHSTLLLLPFLPSFAVVAVEHIQAEVELVDHSSRVVPLGMLVEVVVAAHQERK